MEWGVAEIGEILLWVMAIGVPTAWLTGWVYRMWRKANMPAILGVLNRQRRRDRTIKETRDRAATNESRLSDAEARLEKLEASLPALSEKVGGVQGEHRKLRQKLKSRGVLPDA